jgi:hypothetical protein
LSANFLDRVAYEADPSKWDARINYQYSPKSSTTMLQLHIEKYHLVIYTVEQKAWGWKILLPGLVSQARSQVASMNQSQGEAHVKFDIVTF